MENKKIELLKPKYDVVFQALFGSNKENITQSFISDILAEPIEIIDIKTDDSILRQFPREKAGRLDLKAKFKDGTICQIEMQMTDEKNTIKRLLYYWSKSYSKQLKMGSDYKEANKTIGIIITNYEVEELKGLEDLDTKWQIMETKSGERLLTDDLELRIIELPKAERVLQKDRYNRLAQWLMFLDNPNTERVDEIVKENKEVKKAKSVLHEMSEDEKLQRLAELREKWDIDERSALSSARDEGITQGIEQGVAKGTEKTKLEIAKKMKDENLDIKMIVKITGISKEIIENL